MGDILKHYEKNTEGRDFVIGDLHGCYSDFGLLLHNLKFNEYTDRMFSVGDLVDRGPNSIDCLRLIKKPWFHCIRGNHEDLMITAVLDNNRPDIWNMNGGGWGGDFTTEELRELCTLASHLPLAMTVETDFGKVGICHAQPPKDWSSIGNGMGRDEKYEIIWGRTKIRHRDSAWIVKNIDYTIHGHTPVCMPVTVGNSIYIDTGICFKGVKLYGGRVLEGELTALELSKVPEFAINTSWAKVKKELKEMNKDLFD